MFAEWEGGWTRSLFARVVFAWGAPCLASLRAGDSCYVLSDELKDNQLACKTRPSPVSSLTAPKWVEKVLQAGFASWRLSILPAVP